MSPIFRAFALAAALAACAPTQEQLSIRDHRACQRYGLAYGTAEYARCRQQIAFMRHQRGIADQQANDALMMYGAGLIQRGGDPGGYQVYTVTPPSGMSMSCVTIPPNIVSCH